MPLGMEVGLGPGDFVLDVDSAAPPKKKEVEPPIFGHCLMWLNGWMALGTEVGLSPGHIMLDGDLGLPKGGAQPPIFGPCLL